MVELFHINNFYPEITVFLLPYNTDFQFINVADELANLRGVNVLSGPFTADELSGKKIFWFKGTIEDSFTQHIKREVDIYEVWVCRLYKKWIIFNGWTPNVVISNLKVYDKDTSEEYKSDLLMLLADKPYKITIVPRHPIPSPEKLEAVLAKLPKNMVLSNTMGKLENICSESNLTIMGKIFSDTADDRDHNPLEATINSNAIGRKMPFIPEPFIELYESGLMHTYNNFYDCLWDLENLILDSDLSEKLTWRENWIKKNRAKYLNKWLDLFTKS